MQAMTLALAGNAERVRQSSKTAINLAEQLGHPPSLAHAYSLAAIASIILGDRAETARISQSLAEISEKYKFPPQHVTGLFFLGWARAQGADLAVGLAQMQTHFDRVRAVGVHPQHVASMMADVLLQAGRVEEAYQLAEQILMNMKETDPNFYLGLLLEVRKRCLDRMRRESGLGALPPHAARVVELHDAKMRALKEAAVQSG